MRLFMMALLATSPASLATTALAQDKAAAEISTAEAIHGELRALRDRMLVAYQSRDLDALLADCSDEVVITWQNGQRNVGHQAFRDFYTEMMDGDQAIVEDIDTNFSVDDSSILYGGDTAVARGTVEDRFVLRSGSEFTLDSMWTATLVKGDAGWKVASFHVSASIFDNPILEAAKKSLVVVGLICAACGIGIGLLFARLIRKRKPA